MHKPITANSVPASRQGTVVRLSTSLSVPLSRVPSSFIRERVAEGFRSNAEDMPSGEAHHTLPKTRDAGQPGSTRAPGDGDTSMPFVALGHTDRRSDHCPYNPIHLLHRVFRPLFGGNWLALGIEALRCHKAPSEPSEEPSTATPSKSVRTRHFGRMPILRPTST